MRIAVAIAAAVACATAAVSARDVFDHADHEGAFPSCAACHRGAAEPGLPMFPTAADCARCHDGDEHDLVDWSPPDGTRVSHIRFDHEVHAEEEVGCVDCHSDPGAGWMSVRRAVVAQCIDCHGVTPSHLGADDDDCATCHRPLSEATRLTRERIGGFPRPPSHDAADFATRHGEPAALPHGHEGVAASCATCHARDFCLICHVDGPEVAPIRALAPDERSLALGATLAAPPTHGDPDFLKQHGRAASEEDARCATCHTQESCRVCHVATPHVASALPAAGPGRGAGAPVSRRAPPSHDAWFRDRHGSAASAAPETCAGCHARDDCFLCHRPNAASSATSYHPPDFLSRHPSAAWARETSCVDCHNPQSFCATCHEASGLVAQRGRLGAGYHDGQPAFLAGHGQAARQSLETCVTCHTENDCMTCHAGAIGGGRGFNPHGPGFDAARLRDRAPQMCAVCHGPNIPIGP
jgi:hypothetical protein